jgi:hypothetical protein
MTAGFALATVAGVSQTLPATAGETLSGKRIVVADAVRGHMAVLIVGFSKEAGPKSGEWAKAIRADQALTGAAIYEIASLEQAPGFVRGMIKSGMRKGVSPADQDNFVVLTQDDKQWRGYLGVADDKVPYVVLLDAAGQSRWHGHGEAKDLEPQLKAALH